MTLLPTNFLEFNVPGEGLIPCNGHAVTVQLTGEAAHLLDEELVQNAAAGVLEYFAREEKRQSVSVGEFTAALETVLRGFGLSHVKAGSGTGMSAGGLAEADLGALVGEGLELFFFQRLREELRRQVAPQPRVVRFHGLHGCVMQLAGARRWSPRCQQLHDRIVDYLRSSLRLESSTAACGLVVH
jgi:hypothetical protein